MVRDSIVAKLWLTIVSMVLLVLLLLTFLLQQFFTNYFYQNQSQNLARVAASVQHLATADQLSVVGEIARQLASVEDVNISVDVPYTSDQRMKTAYDTFSTAQRNRFLAGKAVSITSKQGGAAVVSVYLKIPAKPQPGMIIVSQHTSVLAEPLITMRNIILFAMALGVLLTTGLAFVVSKNLSRPLLQMNEVAEEMAKGNFGWRIKVSTNDEVGRLGRKFNALASELAQSIQTLSMERDQLSGILSSLEDGVIATDLEGNITLANPPAVRRLTSLNFEETGIAELNKLPDSMSKLLDMAIERGDSIVRETSWQGRHMIIRMTPLYDGSKIRAIVSVLRDITEERRLDRLRKDFIANVSHELRTPLSMLQGYTEALLDEFGDDPEQRRELTEIILDETLRMRRLVNGLLDLAQLESGQFQMNFSESDVIALVKRVARKFQTLAVERGIGLRVDVPTDPVVVNGDPDRLEQVFTNLVDNAIRHTQEGGCVRLAVSCSSRHANIRVADTGSGIPEEDLPYIWERFYKADKARTRGASGGIGLGLAITKHIVVEHGGDIIVESKMGQGTTFTVALPLLQQNGM
ncbi:HAMP domain-containing protein [Alicyclobacillus cycloheptanicus]|nr:HAMP domain-containing protein [Alicyclobacillus cycloheptanicus]